jgi:hypothetical protein
MEREPALRSLYAAFNARDTEAALAGMTPDVDWPSAWEGGRVVGRDQVREYWERQWAAIDSRAEPVAISRRPNGRVEVSVHQIGLDSTGRVLFDEEVRHVYEFRGALVHRMTIER